MKKYKKDLFKVFKSRAKLCIINIEENNISHFYHKVDSIFYSLVLHELDFLLSNSFDKNDLFHLRCLYITLVNKHLSSSTKVNKNEDILNYSSLNTYSPSTILFHLFKKYDHGIVFDENIDSATQLQNFIEEINKHEPQLIQKNILTYIQAVLVLEESETSSFKNFQNYTDSWDVEITKEYHLAYKEKLNAFKEFVLASSKDKKSKFYKLLKES